MKSRIVGDGPEPSASQDRVDRPADAVAPGPGAVRRVVRRHSMVIFVALSYLIGWSVLPFGSFFPFGPMVAAVVVVAVADGRLGLRRLGLRVIRWRVNWVWYVVAIAVPLGVQALGLGLNVAAGAPAPSFAQLSPWYSVLLALGLQLVNPTEGPLGEEPGWRGFGQARLQASHSPLVSAAILGLVITGWHLPLVFLPQFDLHLPDIITTVLVTFWYAWLFNRTGGSVLLTLIAHATEGSLDINAWWPAGPDADREVWTYLIAWALLVAVLLVADRPAWRSAPPGAVERWSDEPA